MAQLTLQERKDIQTLLEKTHADAIEFYRELPACPGKYGEARDLVMSEMLMAFNQAAIDRETAPQQNRSPKGPTSPPKPNGP